LNESADEDEDAEEEMDLARGEWDMATA